MKFKETNLEGSFILETEKLEDERGFFTRMFDAKLFDELGLNSKTVQCNVSHTKFKGTVRGFHYQLHPFEETKLIRCTRGSIFDIIIDLRPNSPTFKKWNGFELNSKNYRQLYVPKGFAHGFQSLEDDSEVFYQAIKTGYRLIDTASIYKNETFVGEAIKRAIDEGIVGYRDDSIETVKRNEK